jgi:hypothetical protein
VSKEAGKASNETERFRREGKRKKYKVRGRRMLPPPMRSGLESGEEEKKKKKKTLLFVALFYGLANLCSSIVIFLFSLCGHCVCVTASSFPI